MVAERPERCPWRRLAIDATPLSVGRATDREEVARIISKYNLLALPVVDDGPSTCSAS